ncbi:uncharacterized protein A1O5_10129 [Cladophialophora psammophila CBS 110553]|uniref:Cytochrome P450 oxidoreductase n=1 Tax=Cladophialophora psammophila CBS 110553 TaxID=1182543 RepID=W9X919_9EURO|nr:uncharacterized protein A1O5_10129 [Cladophialophora psammophila CBS 110553]EXJ66934.1 hypothetical protein A1O5_10129 [Cladophialophora psammophila CBS 110553]
MLCSLSFSLWSVAIFLLAAGLVRYRRLSSIPGPLLASVTDLWRFSVTQSGGFSQTLKELHDKYGPLVRIGPNTVSVADPAAVPVIHSMHGEFKKPAASVDKAESYKTLRALVNGKIFGTVIDILDENEVSTLKRAVGSAFATKNLLDYEPDVDHTVETLIQIIRKTRTVPLFDLMQQFQVDFLMKAAFSKHTDYLTSGRPTAPVSAYARLVHWGRWQSMPALEKLLFKSPLCAAWYGASGGKPQAWTAMALEEFNKRQNKTAEGYVSDDGCDDRPDLMAKYLTGRNRHKDSVSDESILRMISSTIAAGFDTSAYTMTTILYNLLKSPVAMQKLRTEIDEALDAGRLSAAPQPRFVETDRLDYLGAVIKETMRLQPFVRVLLERQVPPEGAEIASTFLPGGTTVGVSVWNAHFNPAVFGKDADEFRPDRWLEADHHRRLVMERSVLGFGAGKRVCIGRHIAELEMKKVIPRMLLEFNVSDPSDPARWRRPR